MADVQVQARALGDPTRYAIFRFIAEADDHDDVGVAELTARFGLNHNAIRQHVAKLRAAGLVDERRAPPTGGRGRPRLVYRVAPAADGRWGGAGPYERLSVLLAEVLRSGDSPVEVGRRSVGEPTAGADPLTAVTEAMARAGFEPVVVPADPTDATGDGVGADIVLTVCPYAAAAEADAATVCALHRGIAEGVAERAGGRLTVEELVAHDPHVAQCRLRVRVARDAARPGT